MPYTGPDDPGLPPNVKALPADQRRQWVAVWNDVYQRCIDDGGDTSACESRAFPQANGVLKMAELKTRDLEGVELLKVGRWHGEGCPDDGCEFTQEHLDQIVSAYHETEGKHDVPVQLGHDDQQKLLQTDGLPAAGWVTNLRRLGERLIGDLQKVPAAVADLIDAGAYRTRSVQVSEDYEVDGTKYPFVLTHLALLGADLPAVQGLADITKLYSDRRLSLDEGAHVALFQAEAPKKPKKTKQLHEEKEENNVDEQAVRTALGLDEDGDILAAIVALHGEITSLKAAEPGKAESVALRRELSDTRERILTMENDHSSAILEERERHRRKEAEWMVESAIQLGRIAPRNKPMALDMAMRGPEQFETLVRNLRGVDLSERGTSGGETEYPDLEPSDQDIKMAQDMGVKPDAAWRRQFMLARAGEKGVTVNLPEPEKAEAK